MNKRITKRSLALGCAVMAFLLMFSACGSSGNNDDTNNNVSINLDEYSGVYTGNNYLFDLNFSEGVYVCVDEAGRIGNGRCGYEYEQLFLDFDDFIYTVDTSDGGSIKLIQNGSGTDEESLDGFTLTASPDSSYSVYDLSELDGERTNSDGVTINIDTAANECDYSFENGSGSSKLNDDFNGKGIYIYMGSYKAYPILDSDGYLTFEIQVLPDYEETDDILEGRFARY